MATTFGWDTSNYDDPITVRDGIDFFTHKCAEGHNFYKDPEYKASLNNARSLGIPVLGAYFVNHPGSVDDQVTWFLNIVNAETPWWRDVPWMFQIDAEKFSYMSRKPSVPEINAFGDALVQKSGCSPKSVIAYAPSWLYSLAELSAIRYANWASNYGSNPAVHYPQAYPGNTSVRWNPSWALFLQYGSNTIIGNQTTCDANAYRGTVAQLLAAIGHTTDPDNEEYTMHLGIASDKVVPAGSMPTMYLGGVTRREVAKDNTVRNLLATVYKTITYPTSKQLGFGMGPVENNAPVVTITDDQITKLATAIATALGGEVISHDDIVAACKEALNATKFQVT